MFGYVVINASEKQHRAWLHLSAAGLFFSLALLIDLFILKIPIFPSSLPKFGGLYTVRLGLVLMCAFHLIQAVRSVSQSRPAARERGSINTCPTRKPCPSPHSLVEPASFPARLFYWNMILLMGIFLVILFLFFPLFFSIIAREHLLIETFSAFLCFFAGLIFIYLAFLAKRIPEKRPMVLLFIFLMIFGLFFLGLEENSWFQFVFEWDLPEVIESNAQHDLNLHNFATEVFENIYYFGGFVFLVLIPFLFGKKVFRKSHFMNIFVPGEFVLAVGALAVAYNYDNWNGLVVLLSVFLTFFILIDYALSAWRDGRVFWVALLLVFVISQAVFLIFGHNFIRTWDVTEYKEFLIPLGLALYSLEVRCRMLHRQRPVSA